MTPKINPNTPYMIGIIIKVSTPKNMLKKLLPKVVRSFPNYDNKVSQYQ